MRKIAYLNNYSHYIVLKIADKIKAEYFWNGDTIIQEGDEGDRVFFLVSGEIDILKNGKKNASISEPCAFGEKALESNAKRQATVKATSDI